MNDNVEIVRRFLRCIERGETGKVIEAFYAPGAIQEEFPNLLYPKGQKRTVAELSKSSESGKNLVAEQRYDVRNVVASGEQVAVEIAWSCVMKVPLRSVPAGGSLRAVIAAFFTFEGGLIVSQRNYDCYDPF
ncbi:MAG TPA: nuclear transport factor 2 family protein [Polyangiaceae bacterium]|nr:nuclear transport factor 2 family protein [Polyangiaceae bacterium]